jgi:hypothetical protein
MTAMPGEKEIVAEAKQSPLYEIVRPYCADTKEKRDWPHIADVQAAKIVLALVPEVASLVKRLVAAERNLRNGEGDG